MPFRKLVSARIYLLSLAEAGIVTACYIAATFFFFPIDAPIYLQYENGVQHIGLVALTFVVATYLFDFYKQIHVRSRLVLTLQLAHLIGIMLIIQAAFSYVNRELIPSQPVVLAGSALSLVALIGWRIFVHPALWNSMGAHRVLMVGWGAAAELLAEAFRNQPALGMELVGYVGNEPGPHGVPLLGSLSDLRRIVSDANPDRIIVSTDDRRVLRTLFDIRSSGVNVQSAGDIYEAIFGRVYSSGLEPYTVIFRNELSAPPGSVALQSIYTNLLALASVVVMLPLVALIATVVRLAHRGPVLSRATCVGLHGIPFTRFRFRCEGRDIVSRFLARFKLDALPQILNVIRGEMALIGPRAERIEFNQILTALIPFYRQKQSVKPGIMGWSQLHCDVQPTEDTLARLEYDLYYIKHISLVLDAYTVIKAFKWVLTNPETEQERAAIHDVMA
jgi:lipopolysaccharide/colanic/teichoic acid biosynthesis glycosyltransferase